MLNHYFGISPKDKINNMNLKNSIYIKRIDQKHKIYFYL